MWQVGKPIFPGKDEADQLDKIFRIMGTPTKETWPNVDKYSKWVQPEGWGCAFGIAVVLHR